METISDIDWQRCGPYETGFGESPCLRLSLTDIMTAQVTPIEGTESAYRPISECATFRTYVCTSASLSRHLPANGRSSLLLTEDGGCGLPVAVVIVMRRLAIRTSFRNEP
jgi:hypothetical protein